MSNPPSTTTPTASAPQMDWGQVAMNGGPPCFAVLEDEQEDERGWYCGRAQRWEGHDGEHEFVSLERLLSEARVNALREAVKAVEKLICAPQFEGNWRNGYSHAQNDAFRAIEAIVKSED